MNAEKSGWTLENIQMLFVEMKRRIPRTYATCSYAKGLKHVDWNKVAFAPFSAGDCEQKWKLLMKKMRKQRSLTELIVEAEDVLSDPVLNSKIHPDLPKRPPTSGGMFYEENWVKIKEQHPELSHAEVVAATGKAYRELPDGKKAVYVKKYQLALHEYREKTKEFRETSLKLSDIVDTSKQVTVDSEDAEGLPPRPPINGYKIFCKEQMASMAGVSHRDYMKVWAQRWGDLTKSQKKDYSEHCSQMKKTYTIKLQKYIKTLDEEEQKRILHANARYISKEVDMKSGEPKMTSRCLNKTKRQKEKALEDIIEYSKDLQKWFKTLTAAEQEEYQASSPNKCRYVNVKRSSDSEDEDIEDSSSDEEEVYLDCDEDMGEEEEGDITFDMY
ncbi:putative upstream-binding factor 1-like protein 6 [Hippoglossus stenolepis]|uniref:putative upstream-binding factor 1-like protein 6 n=1 Tax=Hippoglossus stenolepis TaxID=195615 RepID=UPI00159BFFF9|nr:putative upstream-binding factor 1-like protein 6 [Hippoglossus stenolepis]